MPRPNQIELNEIINVLLTSITAMCGDRTSAVIMISYPVEGGHDRFMANATGPCMATLGLLEWAGKSIAEQIRDKWITPMIPIEGER